MAYFRIDDGAMTHDKIVALSSEALRLWVAAGTHSMGKLTDGFISDQVLKNVLHARPKLVAELTSVVHGFEHPLWERVDAGFQFHDWLDCQESAETIKKRREGARERMRNVRANNGERSRARSAPLTSPHQLETDTDHRQVPTARPTTDDVHNPVQSVDYVTIADTLGADVGRTVTRLEAATVAGIILDRAKGNPRNPTRYVLGSLRKSPHEWARFIIDGTVPA